MIKSYIDYMKKPFNDEWYTPKQAVVPIIKYLDKNQIIWCPFDNENSEYVLELKKAGYNVVFSHKDTGKDFFNYEPAKWDVMVSNPPFSIKDSVLKRAYELKKPFALLLPLSSLQSTERGKLFSRYGVQILAFNRRINFNNTKGISFATAYFCWNLLPKDLIYRRLK